MFGGQVNIDMGAMKQAQIVSQLCAAHPECVGCEILQPDNQYKITCQNTGRNVNETK